MIKEETVKLTLLEIKNIYEYCNAIENQEGMGAMFSYCVSKNCNAFKTPYEQIMSGIYIVENDPDFKKYMDSKISLFSKYADRNNKGEIVYEADGQTPKITEMVVEFQRDIQSLDKEYGELFRKIEAKNRANNKFLEQEVEVVMYRLSITDIPDKVIPYIVGRFAII